MTTASISPYLLELTVHGATNLPVFDITTSDPFVTVSVDDKEIGRTKTVYKQLSPVFEEKFQANLYHYDVKICFRIYDEDSNKNDLMGIVLFDLSTILYNEDAIRNIHPLMGVDNVTPSKGKIDFSVKLTKNSNVISLYSVPEPLVEESIMSEFETLIPKITSTSIAKSDAILHAIRKSSQLFLDHPKDIEDVIGTRLHLLSDLIQDCTALFSKPASDFDNRIAHDNYMVNCVYIDVSKHSVSSDAYIRIPPTNVGDINSLILVTETNSIILTMQNMYLTWIWLRWLRAALQHWDKGFKHDDWVLEHGLSADLNVTTKQPHKCVEKTNGRCELSLDSPYLLKFNKTSIDFSSIAGIILSIDSRWYEPAYVNIEVTASIDYTLGEGIDIYSSYLVLKSSSGSISSQRTNNKKLVQTFSIDLPKAGIEDNGVYFAYYQGLQNLEVEQGQGYIPFSSLPPLSSSSSSSTSVCLDLNNSFTFSITIVKATSLNFPEQSMTKKVYVKCKAVGWNGERSSKSFLDDCTYHKSEMIDAQPTVTWNDKININVGNNFSAVSESEFFRLEIFVNEIGVLTDNRIGAVFIPFWKFKNKAEMLNLPILQFRNSVNFCNMNSSNYQNLGTGNLHVIIQRITDPSNSSAKLEIKCSPINERSLYSNKWSADCLMGGSMNNANVKAEQIYVDLDHSGLIITIIDEYEYENNTINTNTNNNNSTNTPKAKKRRMAGLCGCTSSSAAGTLEPTTIRGKALAANQDAIVRLCKQRIDLESDTFTVEWDRIQTFTLVSENILSITISIDKYFGENKGNDIFKEVLIEIFVYNCPSNSLKSLIAERKQFNNLRNVMGTVVFSEVTSDSDDLDPTVLSTAASIAAFLDAQANEIESLAIVSSTSSKEEISILELSDKSIEPSLKILEQPSSLMSTKVKEMDALRERAVLLRRLCRFRLYEAVLLALGSEIPGHHISIDDKENISMIDIQSANTITRNDAIETAIARVEYLMKVAENRLRDVVLCGWAQWMNDKKAGESKLKTGISYFINEYLIEMVGILATLLESKSLRSNKGGGLQSKIILINTFVDNNDRLSKICESVLRPYSLSCAPSPCLAAFLDINTLIAFYASTLYDEMKVWVDGVMKIWKDKRKDAGGSSASYQFNIPWNPMRVKGDEGAIISTIPEETKSALEDYARIARLDKDKVQSIFQKSFFMIEEKVAIAYTSSFLYLSSKYLEELSRKDWGYIQDNNLSIEDRFNQQDEEIEWLCSVVNDCVRIIDNSLMIVDEPTKKKKKKVETSIPINKELSYLIADTVGAFESIIKISVDFVASSLFSREDLSIQTLFKIEFSNSRISELFDQLNSAAVTATINTNNANTATNNNNNTTTNTIGVFGHDKVILDFIKHFTPLLNGLSDFLSTDAYVKLVKRCADKLVTLYLFLIREVYESHRTYSNDGAEFQQVKEDIDKIKKRFSKLIPELYVEPLMHHFRILEQVVLLISLDIKELKNVVNELYSEAQGNPILAESLGNFLLICLELRSDYHKIAEDKRQKQKEALTNTHTRRKTFMGMFTSSNTEHPSKPERSRSPSPAPIPEKVKNAAAPHTNSMVSYFRRKSKGEDDVKPEVDPNEVVLALEEKDQDNYNEESKTVPSKVEDIPIIPIDSRSESEKVVEEYNEMIDSIISEYDNSILSEEINLAIIKPVYCVFSKDIRIQCLTFKEIMFKSSSKNISNKLKKSLHQGKKVTNTSNNMTFGFSWGNDNDKTKSTIPKIARRPSSLQTLIITEVRANNLFGLESLRQPKFSLKFEIRGEILESSNEENTVKTSVISGSLNPSWELERYSLNYEFGVENVLNCKLIYSWMVSGDEIIGETNISLTELDFKFMREKYPIDFSLSKKANKKAELYKAEGRELPSIHLHLKIE